MRRVCLILVILGLLTCSLAVPVSAAEVDTGTFNFTVTRLSSSPSTGYDQSKLRSVVYNAFYTNSAVVTSCSKSYLYGWFWDEAGRLCLGKWTNVMGVTNASLLGVYPLSGLELAGSGLYICGVPGASSVAHVYFSKALAEQNSNFVTGTFVAVDWEKSISDGTWILYVKSSLNTVWNSGSSNYSLSTSFTGTDSNTRYYPFGSEYVLWNTVPEGGTSSGAGGSADPGTSPFLSVLSPSTIVKGLFVTVRVELKNRGDISGDIVCFLSGGNSIDTKLSNVSVYNDSVYVWTVDCAREENSEQLTLTFMVDGRPDITYVLKLDVADSQSENEGSSGDLPGTGVGGGSDQDETNAVLGGIQEGIMSLPGKILDGIVGLFVPDADAMAAQQEKWTQLLADRFGAVYEAGEIVTEITDVFTLQGTQTQIQFPSVTIPFGDVNWTFGGWMVDVVPDGFEFLIEILKKILDIVCTLAFVNAMKNRFDRVLEERT